MLNKSPKCINEIIGNNPSQAEVDKAAQSDHAEILGNAVFCIIEGCTIGVELNKQPGLNRNCSGICVREVPQQDATLKNKAVEVYRNTTEKALNTIASIGLKA